MRSETKPIKQRLREYLAAWQPSAITEAVWRDLAACLAPVSESYLRQLLLDTGLPFDQPYAGVRQRTFEELEASLISLGNIYAEAIEAGDRDRARYCRRQVIGAKDKARFAAGNPKANPEKQALKQEMAQWMLVWLEDPAMFPAWVDARKRALSRGQAE